MHLQSFVVSLLLATSVAAHGHHGNGNGTHAGKPVSTQKECKMINKLNHEVELASNATRLAKITNNNATKIAEIQAKASSASVKLNTLEANSTLVSACAVYDAQKAENDECQETFALQRFVQFASNSTAVATATNNNATKISHIATESSKAATKLQTLTSNSTLQAACPAVQQKDECKYAEHLQKFVNVASNTTKLNLLTNNNQTEDAVLQAQAATAQTKLTAFTSNATFVAACNALEQSKGITLTSSSTNTTQKTNAAGVLKSPGARAIGLSTLIVGLLGVFVL